MSIYYRYFMYSLIDHFYCSAQLEYTETIVKTIIFSYFNSFMISLWFITNDFFKFYIGNIYHFYYFFWSGAQINGV